MIPNDLSITGLSKRLRRLEKHILAGNTPEVVSFDEVSGVTRPGDYVFNVMDFGAEGDGESFDQPAIEDATDAAAEVGGTVYFPTGTYLTSEMKMGGEVSGVSFTGEGFSSVLKRDPSVEERITGVFNFDPDDEPVENVTIENLRIDGSIEDASTENDLWSHGINFYAREGLQTKGFEVSHVWSHNNDGTGVRIGASGATVRDVYAWDNGGQGVGLNGGGKYRTQAYNVMAWGNAARGLTLSSGNCSASGFLVWDNTFGGFKTSTEAAQMSFQNGLVFGNDGPGFTTTGESSALVMDNIASVDNAEHGFRFSDEGTNVYAGVLIAQDNGEVGFAVLNDARVHANQLVARHNDSYGFDITARAHIGHVTAERNQNRAIACRYNGRLTVDSAYIANNASGGIQSHDSWVAISDAEFVNTDEGRDQSSPLYTSSGGFIRASDCDLGDEGNAINDGIAELHNVEGFSQPDATDVVWVDDQAREALAGAEPDATKYQTGMVVEDTDNPGTLHYVYNDAAADGSTAL